MKMMTPFTFGVLLAGLYIFFRPIQGLWHQVVQEHLAFSLPSPGTVFFRTPLVFLLFLSFSNRFNRFGWLNQPLASPPHAALAIGGLLLYLWLPFPFEADRFEEYENYSKAVYAILAFSLWAIMSSLVNNPWRFLKKHKGLIALSALITLGLGAFPKYLYEHSEFPVFGALMDIYRQSIFYVAQFFLEPYFPATEVILGQNLIISNGFGSIIAFECSGFQGLQLITLLGVSFLLYEKPPFVRVWAWFALGLVLILCSNLVRVTLLIGIGASGHHQWATDAFHSSAGTFFFALIGALMIYLAHRSSNKEEELKSRPICLAQANLEKVDLIPFLVFLFLTLLFRPLSPDLDWAYPIKVLTLSLVLIVCTNWKSVVSVKAPGWLPLITGLGIGVFWTVLQPEPSSPNIHIKEANLSWILFRMLGSIVLIPIIEERFFRRYLLHLLSFRKARADISTPYELVPCLISSLIFGLVHQNIWGGILSGLIFCWISKRRSNLSDAIWCHAAANLFLTILVVCFDQSHYW